jgi:hypothetical protein
MCQQCNSLRATTYAPDDGPCETETCIVTEEGHEMGVVKLGTAEKQHWGLYTYLLRHI